MQVLGILHYTRGAWSAHCCNQLAVTPSHHSGINEYDPTHEAQSQRITAITPPSSAQRRQSHHLAQHNVGSEQQAAT